MWHMCVCAFLADCCWLMGMDRPMRIEECDTFYLLKRLGLWRCWGQLVQRAVKCIYTLLQHTQQYFMSQSKHTVLAWYCTQWNSSLWVCPVCKLYCIWSTWIVGPNWSLMEQGAWCSVEISCVNRTACQTLQHLVKGGLTCQTWLLVLCYLICRQNWSLYTSAQVEQRHIMLRHPIARVAGSLPITVTQLARVIDDVKSSEI